MALTLQHSLRCRRNIFQGVSAGLRRSRYHGLKKNHFQNVAIAAGINIQRLTDWFEKTPCVKTRTSRFAALNA